MKKRKGMSIVFFVLVFGIIMNSIGLFSCFSKNEEQKQEDKKKNLIDSDDMEEDVKENNNLVEETYTKDETPTVGERVQEILKAQGIPFEIDNDGDVCFEYHFHSCILEQSKSTDYFCLTIGFGFEINEQEMMRLLQVANQLHIRYKMVRMVCFENGIKFSVESLLFPGMDLQHLLSYSLFLLEAVVNESSKLYKGSSGKENIHNSTIGFYEAQDQMTQNKKENEAEKNESDEKEPSDSKAPSIGFNSSRYRV